MESATIKNMIIVFTRIMQKTIIPGFIFPGGGIALRCVKLCIDTLVEENLGISRERIVDYCICQIYAISQFPDNYLKKWKVIHSFGTKALTRFTQHKCANRYYEDKWLKVNGLCRDDLLYLIADRAEHPLYKYVYPDYEDKTKKRAGGTDAGYCICANSTLLWSPFSPPCVHCTNAEKCKNRTKLIYPELYRLRIEEFNKDK